MRLTKLTPSQKRTEVEQWPLRFHTVKVGKTTPNILGVCTSSCKRMEPSVPLAMLPLYQKKLHAQKNYLGINFQKCVMTFRVIDYTKKCLEN